MTGGDTGFARDLLAQYNVIRVAGKPPWPGRAGLNPGAGRIRMALVAETAACVEAAQRIRQFVQSFLQPPMPKLQPHRTAWEDRADLRRVRPPTCDAVDDVIADLNAAASCA